MELRQIRYFVKAAELGSITKTATALDTSQSVISLQITRLETDLGARLLRRTPQGVELTEAGIAFLREAQLILRHEEQGRHAARETRLSGAATVGFAPTTAHMLAVPFIAKMRDRFPDVRLHVIEGLSGQLAAMLNTRKIDAAILFNVESGPHLHVTQVLQEKIFLIGREEFVPEGEVDIRKISSIPLILNRPGNGLRTALDYAFARAGVRPNIVAEIDSLPIIMDVVRQGFGATLKPRSAALSVHGASSLLRVASITDFRERYVSSLCSAAQGELSPTALATVATLKSCMRELVESGVWADASLVSAD